MRGPAWCAEQATRLLRPARLSGFGQTALQGKLTHAGENRFHFQGNLNLFQTLEIRIKFNSCPKIMKLVPLFF
jgi:hypothetical protein